MKIYRLCLGSLAHREQIYIRTDRCMSWTDCGTYPVRLHISIKDLCPSSNLSK